MPENTTIEPAVTQPVKPEAKKRVPKQKVIATGEGAVVQYMLLSDDSIHHIRGNNMLDIIENAKKACRARGLKFGNKNHIITWRRVKNEKA